jgi:hypothetical protein
VEVNRHSVKDVTNFILFPTHYNIIRLSGLHRREVAKERERERVERYMEACSLVWSALSPRDSFSNVGGKKSRKEKYVRAVTWQLAHSCK